MNKLLKDAIADAKAVRETALANAKLALEEAFAPKLQSMLSTKIREEMEEEEPAEDENVDPNAENYGADQNTEMEARMKELAGISEEGDEEMSSDDEEDMGGDDMGDEDFSDEGGEEDYSDEDGEESYDEEPSEDDEDLEEILRELEGEEGEEDMEDESAMMEDFDLDEVIASLREEEGSDEEESEEQVDEEIDLNELLASLEEDTENYKEADSQAMDTPSSKHGNKLAGEEDETAADNVNETSKMKKKMKKMEEEINEAYSAVKFLRTKLSEVNLLNAKLLYVNKLFRNNLTEAQKVKVIENFDRAKTVREAKLVYATLSESLKAAKSSETKTAKKSVMEGFASKATKKTTSVLTEGNDQINRFKKLAGII